MWRSGSLVLLATITLVGMTTSPSDYTNAIVASVCSPLIKAVDIILQGVNLLIDLAASPIFLFIRFANFCLDFVRETSLLLIRLFVLILQTCCTFVSSVTKTIISYSCHLACQLLSTFLHLLRGSVYHHLSSDDIFGKSILSVNNFIQRLVSKVFESLDYTIGKIFETLIKFTLQWIVNECHFVIYFPIKILNIGVEKSVLLTKYVVSLPFHCILWMAKYIVYSMLHPYVCIIYSSCTVGLLVVLVPVAMHIDMLTDIGPLIRWICASAVNTDSRSRVIQALNAIAGGSGHRELLQVLRSIETDIQDDVQDTIMSQNNMEECVVCFQPKRLLKLVPCGHKTTCRDCLEEIGKINNRCPVCREYIVWKV